MVAAIVPILFARKHRVKEIQRRFCIMTWITQCEGSEVPYLFSLRGQEETLNMPVYSTSMSKEVPDFFSKVLTFYQKLLL